MNYLRKSELVIEIYRLEKFISLLRSIGTEESDAELMECKAELAELKSKLLELGVSK